MSKTSERPRSEADLDDARWAAVANRTDGTDGLFYYAVKTTGIYCMPSCSSRLPLRRNVEYFNTAADAVASGFRACRRCRPNASALTDPAAASVIAVCRWIENPDDDPTVGELASRVGWSQRHLSRLFKETTGVTISAYRRAIRSDRVRKALLAGTPVTEAVFDAGYGSMRAFYDHGAPRLGSSPDAFRRGSPGADVRFTTLETSLGVVAVAATERGLCAVRIGDDADALVAEISAEYPNAVLTEADDELADLAAAVATLADGRPVPLAGIPLDLQGTAFQVAVWEALRSIKPGAVATYTEVARAIGRPTAHRAVANACAANPAALVVPCHRVVRADGAIGGYRWGPERKQALLEAESEPTTAAAAGPSSEVAARRGGADR